MSKISKSNTKNSFSSIVNTLVKQIKKLKNKKKIEEKPDFNEEDKEWIDKIDPKKIFIDDIL